MCSVTIRRWPSIRPILLKTDFYVHVFNCCSRSETKYKRRRHFLPGAFDRYLIANLFIEKNVNPGKEKSCIFLKGNAKIAFLSF